MIPVCKVFFYPLARAFRDCSRWWWVPSSLATNLRHNLKSSRTFLSSTTTIDLQNCIFSSSQIVSHLFPENTHILCSSSPIVFGEELLCLEGVLYLIILISNLADGIICWVTWCRKSYMHWKTREIEHLSSRKSIGDGLTGKVVA